MAATDDKDQHLCPGCKGVLKVIVRTIAMKEIPLDKDGGIDPSVLLTNDYTIIENASIQALVCDTCGKYDVYHPLLRSIERKVKTAVAESEGIETKGDSK